ncbi:MAG: amidohydrolase family protein, partial [Pseudomonadota bacterium]
MPSTVEEESEMPAVQAIDIVVNAFTPREVQNGQTGFDVNFMRQVRMPEDMHGGVSIEDYLRRMDAAGVERSLLIAVRAGERNWKGSFEIPYDQIAAYCDQYPDRFSGLAGVDPTRGVEQLKDLDYAVNELGFVGAHFYPHWYRMPPDAPLCYPIYARCVELDIPIMMQVGQNLIYQKEVRLPSVAKPILLDQVAIDFPDLK